ncbi:MAG: UbiX family flavin prenyltransferase [Kiritimatiellales bacterium]|nr:UbiX family flavin prenyltransferase [Kiritimatiellales bacterium]
MNLVVVLTGATGVYAAKALIEKSPWPVTLVASELGRHVYEHECGPFEELAALASDVWNDSDLTAPIASGSVPTIGMVILPCTVNTLGKIANGVGDTLITRAAHCHLKEQRKLILCVRETPWTLINVRNAEQVAAAGGTIMPLSPPFYMAAGRDPSEVTMAELIDAYIDRVLAILGQPAQTTWEDVR